jgi:hypothetical protein
MAAGRAISSILGALIPLLVFVGSATGQIYEDRMDPAELGIGDIDSLTIPKAPYVGNEICKTCHASAFRNWLGTRHAQAFIPMRSMRGMMMAEQAGISVCCPDKSGMCMRCHATAHDVPAEYREETFRMGEGVSCEKCHGPGGEHMRAMSGDDPSADAAMISPTEEDCLVCHRPKPSHEMLNKASWKSFAEAWKHIAHTKDYTR